MVAKLGDGSKTGKAIRDSETLQTIVEYAGEEGLSDLVDILKLSTEAE